MNIWELAILKSISSRGGKADTKSIYVDLTSGKFINLEDKHLLSTVHGGRPAYQHQVRSHLSNLKQTGNLTKVSRGIYSITDSGRKRIA